MNKPQWAVTTVLVPAALCAPASTQPEAAAPTVPGVTTSTPQQRRPANTTTAVPPAVTMPNADNRTAAVPVRGANSFTADQARRRTEAGGFAQVSGLRKDDDGIWPGQAMQGRTSVSAFCDYQGNVGASHA